MLLAEKEQQQAKEEAYAAAQDDHASVSAAQAFLEQIGQVHARAAALPLLLSPPPLTAIANRA